MMPVVYTEVDGGRLGDERLPRRVAWGSRRGGRDGGSRERGGGFAGRIMRLFGCFSGSSGFIAAARERLTLGMGDFLSEMAAMMNNSKPSENNTGDSFEQLQDLLNEMFQGDPGAFSSSSCSTSNFTSSCSFVFDTNDQRSSFETSSMGINNDPFGFDPRAHHAFSLGVDHQQDFKKGKNNGGRRNRRKNNVPSAAHETSSNNNYGVPTS